MVLLNFVFINKFAIISKKTSKILVKNYFINLMIKYSTIEQNGDFCKFHLFVSTLSFIPLLPLSHAKNANFGILTNPFHLLL